jgi:hypothetical protein
MFHSFFFKFENLILISFQCARAWHGRVLTSRTIAYWYKCAANETTTVCVYGSTMYPTVLPTVPVPVAYRTVLSALSQHCCCHCSLRTTTKTTTTTVVAHAGVQQAELSSHLTISISMLDLSPYPPAPVTWAYTALDTVCEVLPSLGRLGLGRLGLTGGCSHWRQWIPESYTAGPGAWFSEEFRLGPVMALFPSLTTYSDFLQQEPAKEHSLTALKQFAFETPSTSLGDTTTPSSILVLVVLVVLLRLIKAFLMPRFSTLGRRTARLTHGKEWEQKKANQIRIVKFGEYVFRLLFHSCISLAGIFYFWDKEWWKPGNTQTLFMDYPNQPIAPGMAWYYLVQSAYNIDAMVSLLEMSLQVRFFVPSPSRKIFFPISIGWAKEVRGDFREMFIHHVVTNLLVIGSSSFRFARAGSMVFLIHDISDVPVDLSKLANFLKWKATTATCFASMVLVWCMTRLGVLPFVIYRSVLNESWMVCASGVIDPIYFVYYKPIFVFLIGLLILLHLAWFTMFVQMGWVLISKGEAHDLSEHKKGEAQLHHQQHQTEHQSEHQPEHQPTTSMNGKKAQ